MIYHVLLVEDEQAGGRVDGRRPRALDLPWAGRFGAEAWVVRLDALSQADDGALPSAPFERDDLAALLDALLSQVSEGPASLHLVYSRELLYLGEELDRASRE